MTLPNNATIAQIVASLQASEGINQKADLVTIAGSPWTTVDTMAAIIAGLQTDKNNLAAALVAKGGSATGAESIDSLVSKVNNIVPQGINEISVTQMMPEATGSTSLNDPQMVKRGDYIFFMYTASATRYLRKYTISTNTLSAVFPLPAPYKEGRMAYWDAGNTLVIMAGYADASNQQGMAIIFFNPQTDVYTIKKSGAPPVGQGYLDTSAIRIVGNTLHVPACKQLSWSGTTFSSSDSYPWKTLPLSAGDMTGAVWTSVAYGPPPGTLTRTTDEMTYYNGEFYVYEQLSLQLYKYNHSTGTFTALVSNINPEQTNDSFMMVLVGGVTPYIYVGGSSSSRVYRYTLAGSLNRTYEQFIISCASGTVCLDDIDPTCIWVFRFSATRTAGAERVAPLLAKLKML